MCFSWLDLGYRFLGVGTTELKYHSCHITSKINTTNMIYDCWCWSFITRAEVVLVRFHYCKVTLFCSLYFLEGFHYWATQAYILDSYAPPPWKWIIYINYVVFFWKADLFALYLRSQSPICISIDSNYFLYFKLSYNPMPLFWLSRCSSFDSSKLFKVVLCLLTYPVTVGFFQSTFWHYKVHHAHLICFLPQQKNKPFFQEALVPMSEDNIRNKDEC